MNRHIPTWGCLVLLMVLGWMLPIRSGVQATSTVMDSRLHGYEVNGKPLSLSGLDHDGSGITWHGERKSLFVIRNKLPMVQELDETGQYLRKITLAGFSDTEGIAWISGNLFAVLEERHCAVVFFEISSDTQTVERDNQFSVAWPHLNPDRGNRGCEDVAWDRSTSTLYLSREKSPVRLLRVEGINPASILAGTQQASSLVTHEFAVGEEDSNLFGNDISGMHFDVASQQLLVMSDESRSVTGIDAQGRLSASFGMGWFSSGLTAAVPQPEGLTLNDQGTLFVISEPDKLYIFDRKLN